MNVVRLLFLVVPVVLAVPACVPVNTRCPDGYMITSDGRCFPIDAGMAIDSGGADSPAAVDAGCTSGSMQACGMSVGVCHMGMQSCVGGAWGACTGNVDPTTETCNAMDDDCDGMSDETFACVQNAATGSCTTSCGSMGFGACSATCTAAPPASCAPPLETCNTLDDDCDGYADEGVLMVGQPVTGMTGPLYTAAIVPMSSGFMLFAETTANQVVMQALDHSGAPVGSMLQILLTILPNAPPSAHAAGAEFVLAYATGTQTVVVRVNASAGVVAGPTAIGPGYERAIVRDADATSATIYADSMAGSALNLTRYRVNTTTATIAPGTSIPIGALGTPSAFDVATTPSAEYVAYVAPSGSIMLARAPSGNAGGFAGNFVTLGGSASGASTMALSLRDAASAISAANPLGVAWAVGGSTQFFEVTAPSVPTVGADVILGGGSTTSGDSIALVPVMDNTVMSAQSSAWTVFTTSMLMPQAWLVLGGVSTPTSRLLTTNLTNLSSAYLGLTVGPFGARLAMTTMRAEVITAPIGCLP